MNSKNPKIADLKYLSNRLEKKQIARIFSPVVVAPKELNDRLEVGQYFFSEIVDNNTGVLIKKVWKHD